MYEMNVKRYFEACNDSELRYCFDLNINTNTNTNTVCILHVRIIPNVNTQTQYAMKYMG